MGSEVKSASKKPALSSEKKGFMQSKKVPSASKKSEAASDASTVASASKNNAPSIADSYLKSHPPENEVGVEIIVSDKVRQKLVAKGEANTDDFDQID